MKRLATVLCLLILGLPGLISGAQMIDERGVKLTAIPSLATKGTSGYNFFRVVVANRSGQERNIKFSLKSSYGGELENISRSFTIAKGESRIESIFFPILDFSADGMAVEVDGILLSENLFPFIRSFRNHYNKKQALVDNKIPRSEFDSVFGSGGSGFHINLEMSQFEGSNSQLDTNWLAFSQFNTLIFYADSLNEMTNETREAIFDYLRAGGSLIVLGQYSPPEDFAVSNNFSLAGKNGEQFFEGGFGKLFVIPANSLAAVASMSSKIRPLLVSDPFLRISSRSDFPLPFKDSEMETVSAKWLMIIVYAFAFFIGPVNVYVLHKMRRKIWVFWTVPVASTVCCLIIFGYYIIFESSTLLIKKRSLTLLDQRYNRAITLGNFSVFSSSSRSSGFHFNYNTEVWPLMVRSYRRTDGGKFVRLNEDQHFAEGWIRPKIPRYLHLRSVHTRRERLTIESNDDGINLLNGLGANIKVAFIMGYDGKMYECSNLKAGSKGILSEVTMQKKARRIYSPREIFDKEWYNQYQNILSAPENYLKPGMYIAGLTTNPFLAKQTFENGSEDLESIVLGIMSNGGLK